MATFLIDLWESVFTPGPTPSLVIATNASFAALQAVLLLLLVTTHSIHFIILSFLSAGLWWAINWFVTELQAANEKEAKAKRLKDARRGGKDTGSGDDSGTETEEVVRRGKPIPVERVDASGANLAPGAREDVLKKRRSLGSVSGTDSEWDKVEVEGEEN